MNLDRRMLRRIINEEANKLGVRLNEKVVGQTGRRGDPVDFTWLPDLKRWEATGKIIDDKMNDMILNYPVAGGGSVGDFTCMSMIYDKKVRFKWVDQNGNKIKSLEKPYDQILVLVANAFDAYMASLPPEQLREEQRHLAEHTKSDVPAASERPSAGTGTGRADRIVNPLYASRTAPSPAPSPMAASAPLRRAGAAPSMSPSMSPEMSPAMSPSMSRVQASMLADIKEKVEVFIEKSSSLMLFAGGGVPDDVFQEYQDALEDLQKTMNGG